MNALLCLSQYPAFLTELTSLINKGFIINCRTRNYCCSYGTKRAIPDGQDSTMSVASQHRISLYLASRCSAMTCFCLHVPLPATRYTETLLQKNVNFSSSGCFISISPQPLSYGDTATDFVFFLLHVLLQKWSHLRAGKPFLKVSFPRREIIYARCLFTICTRKLLS